MALSRTNALIPVTTVWQPDKQTWSDRSTQLADIFMKNEAHFSASMTSDIVKGGGREGIEFEAKL